MTFLEQSLGFFTSVSRSHISKLVQVHYYTRAPPLHTSCSLRSACVLYTQLYSTVLCTVYSTAGCTGSGCSRKLTSSGSQETSFMLRQCSLAKICHHMTSAVVDITPSHCCVFRSLPLSRLGAVLELENILEEVVEGCCCVMLGGAAL